MKIVGIEGMSPDQMQFEIQRGAKLICYQYCISILVITFRRSSDAYFLRAGESAVSKGLPWTLLSLVAGWQSPHPAHRNAGCRSQGLSRQ